MSQSRLTHARKWSTITCVRDVQPVFEAERAKTHPDLDIITYDGLSDAIIWLQRDNDALNTSLRTAKRMAKHPGLQRALRDLCDAERRLTEFTAEIIAGVQPHWDE